MLRLLKGFLSTDKSLLRWILWLTVTVATVLIYGFGVGGMISLPCLCILWCVISGMDLLLSALSKPADSMAWRIAYALLKGFGAVLLAVILYNTVNRLSPTLVTSYEAYAESAEITRGGTVTVTFIDPDGQEKTGEMPDYGCFADVDATVDAGDRILVREYEGLFDLEYATVTALPSEESEKHKAPAQNSGCFPLHTRTEKWIKDFRIT